MSNKSIGDMTDERRAKVQEESRKLQELMKMHQREYEEKKKLAEELKKREEAEKVAYEKKLRHENIQTQINNAVYGLKASGIVTVVLVLLIITNATAIAQFITLIGCVMAGFYAIRNIHAKYSILFLFASPFIISAFLFIFTPGGWAIPWIFMIFILSVISFFNLRKYKKEQSTMDS
ncbi:hypothetical protein QYF50_07205 [Paenibacillus vini]|uniref:hypothetical protein n=1 Tax=Paenibacillus vini TaxID=1476024 RepID=UPI0025B6C774|nr:hypothetical protein [Paenibacillus vini]MDN4067679.1 hypothetical protein [Paenibacillus vini]